MLGSISLLFAALLVPADGLHLTAAVAPINPIVAPLSTPTAARVAQIQGWLSATAVGPGRPISDRVAWRAAAAQLPEKEILAEAERVAGTPVPPLPDESYLLFTQKGTRTEYERALQARMTRITTLAWAEALEAKGRFIAPLARDLTAVLEQRTWMLPAHDPTLDNFAGRRVEVDLGGATTAWMLATIDYWLGERLPSELRQKLRTEIERRAIAPYLALLHGAPRSSGWWWVTGTNNWNAVCHAGVVGAALALGVSTTERAELIAAAEMNLTFYFDGFTSDGYCGEGVGYWNYGFGHAVMLAEMVRQATSGKVQLIQGKKAQRIIDYPAHIAILPEVYPSFADGNLNTRPDLFWRDLARRELAPDSTEVPAIALPRRSVLRDRLYETALKCFGRHDAAPAAEEAPTARYWFDDAHVLVSRANASFGVAIKGGNNGESHGHNALGSFVVAVGSSTPVLDPGGEVYTARTFGPHRYDSKVLNSYGHSVPVVAGKLQSAGRNHSARVLATDFSSEADRVVLDLAGGYEVPTLVSLQRELRLTRGHTPAVVVSDTVEFKTPESFATALITLSPWHQDGDDALVVGEGHERLRVELHARGGKLRIVPETLDETLPSGGKVTRIGLVLDTPVTSATISIRMTPSP